MYRLSVRCRQKALGIPGCPWAIKHSGLVFLYTSLFSEAISNCNRRIIWLLLFAISFLNALLDTHPHCFNKDEEYHVINKYLPKRSVTECPDFEETIDACCNKCEQHYGQRSWKQIFHFLIESKATAHAIPGTNIVKSLCSVKPGCSYPSLSEVELRRIST